VVDGPLIKGHDIDSGENGAVITIRAGTKKRDETEHVELERLFGPRIEITVLDSRSKFPWKLR
jgi:hypothetical protein